MTEWTMSDADLADFLGFTPAEVAAHPYLIANLEPEKRQLYERMASVCVDLNMGIVPDGVIVCRPKCGGRRI